MAEASERRDARAAARSETRDPIEAAIEEATVPADRKRGNRDGDLLN